MMEIKAAIEATIASVLPSVVPFNSCLINRYADGDASIRWHADDESCYGDSFTSTIASVSFGARRTFCLRRRVQDKDGKTHQLLRQIALPPGSLLIMCGATQAFWQHSLPPDKSHRTERINLTFRHVFYEASLKHHHSSKTLEYLEERALALLQGTIERARNPVHICNLGVGDSIILHLQSRLLDSKRDSGVVIDSGGGTQDGDQGNEARSSAVDQVEEHAAQSAGCRNGMRNSSLSGGQARFCDILVVDSLHLQDETLPFLQELEALYATRACVFRPVGCENKQDFARVFGESLFHSAPQRYREVRTVACRAMWVGMSASCVGKHRLSSGALPQASYLQLPAVIWQVCWEEPAERGLRALDAQTLVTAKRRDHGGHAQVLPQEGDATRSLPTVNPLAYWTFEDCFEYAAKYKIPLHPLLARGFPAFGDWHSTVPVPPDASVAFINYSFVGRREVESFLLWPFAAAAPLYLWRFCALARVTAR